MPRAARGEAAAGQPQRRHRVRLRTPRISREVGGLEGLKKWLLERRKLFQMRDSLERGDRAQGPAHDGDPGLRQEPLRQGHRVVVSSCRCTAST